MKALRMVLAIAVACILALLTFNFVRGVMDHNGGKSCVLCLMDGALSQYASHHNGWFPRSDKGPYVALGLLYPYLNAKTLCGITGDSRALEDALAQGRSIDESTTSWRYVQGLKTSDSGDLAILWESKAGVSADGRRNSNGGHAVLFLNGDITNVPRSDWDTFMANQASLRRALFSGRN